MTQNDLASFPFSQYTIASDFVFVSGTIGRNDRGEISGDVAAQTEQALLNVRQKLRSAGSDLCQVVKATVFLTDIETVD